MPFGIIRLVVSFFGNLGTGIFSVGGTFGYGMGIGPEPSGCLASAIPEVKTAIKTRMKNVTIIRKKLRFITIFIYRDKNHTI